MHLTALSHWSRSIGTGGRHASEPVDAITGMRTLSQYVPINVQANGQAISQTNGLR
jgi:hypothetical protein